jgi:ATP-dependent DNA ligase
MSPLITRRLPDIQPSLLTPRAEPFDDSEWLFEPKYDGFRGLLHVTRKGCYIRSMRATTLNG